MEYNDTSGNSLPDKDRNEPTPISVILENEILMMKLNAEFGATIFLPDTRASPEIENYFLRSVYAIEKQLASVHPRSSIYEIIGRPIYPAEATLDDHAVSGLLEKLLDLLYDHKIVLDTIADYPDRTLYKFIVDEFFTVELDHTPGAEYFIPFCYEDFYPNNDFDLRQAAVQFAGFLMDLKDDGPRNGLYQYLLNPDGVRLGWKDVIGKIKESAMIFDERVLKSFAIGTINVSGNYAVLEARIQYTGTLRGGELVDVNGNARLEFALEKGMWWITSFSFPGIIY